MDVQESFATSNRSVSKQLKHSIFKYIFVTLLFLYNTQVKFFFILLLF